MRGSADCWIGSIGNILNGNSELWLRRDRQNFGETNTTTLWPCPVRYLPRLLAVTCAPPTAGKNDDIAKAIFSFRVDCIVYFRIKIANRVRDINLMSTQNERSLTYFNRNSILRSHTFSKYNLSGSPPDKIEPKSANSIDAKSVMPGRNSKMAFCSALYSFV